jgi:hypothetical protein
MNVIPTGAIFYGICQISSEQCSAKEGGAVTAIRTSPIQEQINVCKACLDYQIRNRKWHINGAYVPGMRVQLDLAVIDSAGNVVIAVEVKNWGHPSPSWANKIAIQTIARDGLSAIPYLLLATPTLCYICEIVHGLINDDNIVEVNVAIEIAKISKTLNVEPDTLNINDGAEFRNSPYTAAKKHMELERCLKYLLEDRDFISRLPPKIIRYFKDSEVRMEYVLPKF